MIRNINLNTPRKKRKADNYRFALGMGMNFVDLDRNCMYMLQEYKEKMDDPTIPLEKKPKKIRIMSMDGKTELGAKEPELIEELMKDPEPDPKYAYDPPVKGKW